MKKSELENGAVVEMANGSKFFKIDQTLIGFDLNGWMSLSDYDDNLKYKSSNTWCNEWDIMKVCNEVSFHDKIACQKAILYSARGAVSWTWVRPANILDKEEKTYLSSVIKPWRDKVSCIMKVDFTSDGEEEFIVIQTQKDGNVCLPAFKAETMYKGMILDDAYTPEDLGI